MHRVRKELMIEDDSMKNYTGKGVCVAVLDSGISRHPDLWDRVDAFYDFTHKYKNKIEAYDDFGHGTHVAGIIGGNGSVSNGYYKGIAPECRFVVGKVLDQQGSGDIEDLYSGLQWVLVHKDDYQIRILNISIGIVQEAWEKGMLLYNMLEKVAENNILITVSAGNDGPAPKSLSSLGESQMVMTVGCFDKSLIGSHSKPCQNYTGRGPGRREEKKPDIVAPGTDIVSCNHKCIFRNGRYKNAYCMKSGTSMSAPIVAGCVALMLEKYPYLTADECRNIIRNHAEDLKIPWYIQGNGLINIKESMMLYSYYSQ